MKVIHFIPAMLCAFAVLFLSGYQIGKCSVKPTSPTSAVADLRTIGSACTMKQVVFSNGVQQDRWEDAQGKLCAFVNKDGDYPFIFDAMLLLRTEHDSEFMSEADAVQWVESRPYRQGAYKPCDKSKDDENSGYCATGSQSVGVNNGVMNQTNEGAKP